MVAFDIAQPGVSDMTGMTGIEKVRRIREILAGLAEGNSHRLVADARGIDTDMACLHIRDIYKKLQALTMPTLVTGSGHPHDHAGGRRQNSGSQINNFALI